MGNAPWVTGNAPWATGNSPWARRLFERKDRPIEQGAATSQGPTRRLANPRPLVRPIGSLANINPSRDRRHPPASRVCGGFLSVRLLDVHAHPRGEPQPHCAFTAHQPIRRARRSCCAYVSLPRVSLCSPRAPPIHVETPTTTRGTAPNGFCRFDGSASTCTTTDGCKSTKKAVPSLCCRLELSGSP